MSKPLVSVIVPIYNMDSFLRRCVASIMNQTLRELEIILVNDGSTDTSSDIIREMALADSRVKVINQVNQGVSAARNAGLKVAKGKYIGFVDSDDYIEPDMYSTMLQEMKLHKADLIICGYRYVNDLEEYRYVDFSKIPTLMNKTVFFKYLFNTPRTIGGAVWNKLFIKNKIVSLFDKNISISEDWMFVSKYALNCQSIRFVGGNYYNVFLNSDSATRQVLGKTALGLAPYRQLIDIVKEAGQSIQEIAEKNFLDACVRHYYMLENQKESYYFKISMSELRGYIRKHYKRILKNPEIQWKLKILCFIIAIKG